MRTRKADFDCMVWMGLKKPPSDSPMDSVLSWRALIAEYLGTLLLVFFGTILSIQPGAPVIAGPFAGGFAVGTIVKAIAHVSGGHINPAVSIGFFACHRMTLIKTILYILAQCLGAISGSAILKAVTPENLRQGHYLGPTLVSDDMSAAQGMVIEIIITFLLVFVVVSATDGGRKDVSGSVPLAIGVYIVGAAFAAGGLTGACMNPARSLGPAVISGTWTNHWVYWAGPVIGAIVAALLYHNLFDAKFVIEMETDDGEEDPQAMNAHHGHDNPRSYIESRYHVHPQPVINRRHDGAVFYDDKQYRKY